MLQRLLGLLLLALGVTAMAGAVRQAPALNPEQRVDGAGADWHVPVSGALYDPAAYNYQRGYAGLFGGLLDATGPSDPSSTRDLFLAGLVVAPADAYLWSGLAWAAAMDGDSEASLEALHRSLTLSPYSAELSPERVMLIETLVGDQGLAVLDRLGRTLVCGNLEVAAKGESVEPATFLAAVPSLQGACEFRTG